jgi:threonine-phosphate decarboxylase
MAFSPVDKNNCAMHESRNPALEEYSAEKIRSRHGGMVWLANGERSRWNDFSANVRPHSFDPSALQEGVSNLDVYPDPSYTALVAAAASMYGVERNQVFPANGSTEALYLAMLTLKPGSVTIFEPTFSEYAKATQWASPSAEIIRIVGEEQSDFRFRLSVPSTDVIALCNPNNPTGGYIAGEELAAWIEACERHGVFVILDEAFIEFCHIQNASITPELSRRSNLLILRSMTKYFGIPGLRLGFALGPTELIARIWENRIPWSINCVAERLGVDLTNSPWDTEIPAMIARERAFLSDALRTLGWRVLPAAANFILCRLPHGSSNRRLLASLKEQGFLLRDARNFHGLDDSYVRCAVKERSQNEALLKAIEHWSFAETAQVVRP